MTRWARAGNTQRHKKMPEDPTPWEEFKLQGKRVIKRKQKHENRTKMFKSVDEKLNVKSNVENSTEDANFELRQNECNYKRNLNQASKNIKKCSNSEFSIMNCKQKNPNNKSSTFNLAKFNEIEKNYSTKEHLLLFDGEQSEESHQSRIVIEDTSKTIKPKSKKKKKCKLTDTSNSLLEKFEEICDDKVDNMSGKYKIKMKEEISDELGTEDVNSEKTKNSKSDEEVSVKCKKKMKAKKNKRIKDMESNRTKYDWNMNVKNETHNDKLKFFKKNKTKTAEASFFKKKSKREVIDNSFIVEEISDKLDYKNEGNANKSINLTGESKPTVSKKKKKKWLDKIKEKRLKSGILLLPPNIEKKLYQIKKNLRERKVPGETIKEIIRKVRRKEELKFRKTLKTCYNCRQTGHILANCPMVLNDAEQGTGICFKCGSTEHTSFKCNLKTSDFPFAKCFICGEQGHLSRNCPQNTHGAYPKGGKCNLCGDIYHLKKDCPKLKKKDTLDEPLTAQIMDNKASVDDDDEKIPVKTVPQPNKAKIVKFL